jgi:hypothetical protein
VTTITVENGVPQSENDCARTVSAKYDDNATDIGEPAEYEDERQFGVIAASPRESFSGTFFSGSSNSQETPRHSTFTAQRPTVAAARARMNALTSHPPHPAQSRTIEAPESWRPPSIWDIPGGTGPEVPVWSKPRFSQVSDLPDDLMRELHLNSPEPVELPSGDPRQSFSQSSTSLEHPQPQRPSFDRWTLERQVSTLEGGTNVNFFQKGLRKMEVSNLRTICDHLNQDWIDTESIEAQENLFEKRLWMLAALRRLNSMEPLNPMELREGGSSRKLDWTAPIASHNGKRVLEMHGHLGELLLTLF